MRSDKDTFHFLQRLPLRFLHHFPAEHKIDQAASRKNPEGHCSSHVLDEPWEELSHHPYGDPEGQRTDRHCLYPDICREYFIDNNPGNRSEGKCKTGDINEHEYQ